jgi:hypothetical protein
MYEMEAAAKAYHDMERKSQPHMKDFDRLDQDRQISKIWLMSVALTAADEATEE